MTERCLESDIDLKLGHTVAWFCNFVYNADLPLKFDWIKDHELKLEFITFGDDEKKELPQDENKKKAPRPDQVRSIGLCWSFINCCRTEDNFRSYTLQLDVEFNAKWWSKYNLLPFADCKIVPFLKGFKI